MTDSSEKATLRIERALRLVPELETLEPLRALIVSASQPPERTSWTAAAPYLTIGKRTLWPPDVRERRRQVLSQFTQHISQLYEAVIDVLEGEQRGDIAAAVRALLKAGDMEERAGRVTQAMAWYEVALAVTKDFQERRLEFDTVFALAHVLAVRGEYAEAAGYYQRGLALGESAGDTECIIRACQGLGRLGHGLGPWGKAEWWFNRGLALAKQESDRLATAQFYRDLSTVARQQDNLSLAQERLQLARTAFQDLEAAEDMAFAMNDQGLLDGALGHPDDALLSYRQALDWLRLSRQNLWLEVAIRINMADAYMAAGRFPEATEELRRGEEITIIHTFKRGLAQIYMVMGRLCRRQLDENGFVFFENALELCRAPECARIVEAEIYYEYGVFRGRLGHREEAHAYMDRARVIFDSVGDHTHLAAVRAELDRLQT